MTVEFLGDGAWVPFPNVTEQHIESNRYLVTVKGVAPWVRLTALDGAPLRVAGKETFNVWGRRRSGDELLLDVLMRV